MTFENIQNKKLEENAALKYETSESRSWVATTMELFTSAALDQGGWVWLGLGWSGTYRG